MKQPLKSEESLNKKVMKGGVWLFSLRVMERGLDFIRLLILARLLAPNDFGLLGIALLTISTVETFSQTGFQAALIQKKGNIADYLDTAWTASVIRGISLFIILFFLAPYVGLFFNTPEASLIIRVIGVSMLLTGFNNIGILYFQKELEFNKQFIFQLVSTLTNFIVAVSTALILKNVWALIWGMVIGSLAGLITSYLIHPYRPRFSFDLEKVKELFGFGKWVFGSTILIFLITQGDDIFVGKLLGLTALGFYQMAFRIANMPTTEISHVISQVTFPAYSKMQDNLPRLRESYLRVLQLTAFLSFPIAGLIFVLAPDFTRIFLGEKWMPMVPAMQVLTLYGLIRSVGATTGSIFQAVGRPDLITKLQVMVLVLLVVLIYPLSMRWGILGTAFAIMLSTLVVHPITNYLIIKTIKGQVLEFVKMLFIPMVTASVMVSVIAFLKYAVFGEIGGLVFFILIAAGISIYLGIIQVIDIATSYGIRTAIHENIVSIKK